MAVLAATLFAASTQGSTPASPLNCTLVRIISNASICDRLRIHRRGRRILSLFHRCYRMLQDVTGCCDYEKKGESGFELSSHALCANNL